MYDCKMWFARAAAVILCYNLFSLAEAFAESRPSTTDLNRHYEAIMPTYWRTNYPELAHRSFRTHLADSYKKYPSLDQVSQANLRAINMVEGTMTYVGIVSKKYRYSVFLTDQGLVLNVRIHLKDASQQDFNSFTRLVEQASDTWNRYRIETDFNYIFKFEIVADRSQAHFSVNIKDSTRGPYDKNWARSWTSAPLAHEIGHMMGLGDEYKIVSGNTDICLQGSIMCDPWLGSPMPHHYYFILRRLIQ